MGCPARCSTVIVLVGLLAGCAYPRRSTSLSPAREATAANSAPPFIWRLQFVSASVPPRQRSGHPWDDDGSPPDPFIRLYRDDHLIFESAVRTDTLDPQWNVTLEKNFSAPARSNIRIELWDWDRGIVSDPIGLWRGRGLPPTALPGADARVNLDGGATLLLRVQRPHAHRGVGISLYEVRSDALVVLEVIEASPAGRAGIHPGDRIVAVGDASVAHLREAAAASALSMAAEHRSRITVERPDGQRDQVELDRGMVWLTM